MIVHGARPSPFVRKVLVALEEKGASYELSDLTPFPKSPELLEKHPLGKIPILETDDGTFLPDSSVICAYIEKVHARPSLYPSDSIEFAKALFIEEYADTKMIDVIGAIFFESFVKPNVFKQETDKERVNQIVENDLPEVLAYLEKQVPEGGGAIFGDLSIADIALGAHLGGLRYSGLEIDAGLYPKLASYAQNLLARPSFEKAMNG